MLLQAPRWVKSILMQILRKDTRLCVAADLTLKTEFIRTLPVEQWKNQAPDLNKRPAIFILQA